MLNKLQRLHDYWIIIPTFYDKHMEIFQLYLTASLRKIILQNYMKKYWQNKAIFETVNCAVFYHITDRVNIDNIIEL